MSEALKALHLLGDLLQGAQAIPVIRENRIAPSTVYDLDYRVMVTGCAFQLHSKTYADGRRIRTPKLKLLQFVAMRPWLLPVVEEWSHARHDAQVSMLTSQRLRRGFLGDRMHEAVLELLIAKNIFVRQPSHVRSGIQASLIEQLSSEAVTSNLFASERKALDALAGIAITEQMLEGW